VARPPLPVSTRAPRLCRKAFVSLVPVPGSDAPPCAASQHSARCCGEPRSRTPVPLTTATKFATSLAAPRLHRLYQAGHCGAGEPRHRPPQQGQPPRPATQVRPGFRRLRRGPRPGPSQPAHPLQPTTRRYGLAVADYTQAIELDPDFALAHLNRGIARERRGDARAAAEDYRKVLAINPILGAGNEGLIVCPHGDLSATLRGQKAGR
jgi:tetratricopeptide (TPR) repeat protein